MNITFLLRAIKITFLTSHRGFRDKNLAIQQNSVLENVLIWNYRVTVPYSRIFSSAHRRLTPD